MAENGTKLVNLNALESLAQKIVAKYTSKQEASDTYATKQEVDAKISSVYTPGGSIDSPISDYLNQENLGKVYNVKTEFTADSSTFVDASDGSYPAGTNVVVVSDGGSYKFDVLSGFVDLSPYVLNSELSNKMGDFLQTQVADGSSITEMLEEVFDS